MANEKCGACGSSKTSILGQDKRVGKTCGNEDCSLHLTVIDWPPEAPPAPPAAPPAGVGARTCSIHLVKNCPMCENTIQPGMGYQATPTPKEGVPDLAHVKYWDGEKWLKLTYQEFEERLRKPPAGPAVDLEALLDAYQIATMDFERYHKGWEWRVKMDKAKAAILARVATPPAGPAVDAEAEAEKGRAALAWMLAQAKAINPEVQDDWGPLYLSRVLSAKLTATPGGPAVDLEALREILVSIQEADGDDIDAIALWCTRRAAEGVALLDAGRSSPGGSAHG